MIIGAIKVKDGLFIGDELASKDLEFVIQNKVTRIVNCAAKQLPCVFANYGVTYLKFNWLENEKQILFPNDTVNEIFQFIEQAHNNGESVLVHSIRGQSRSCCALAAYFMRKYKWKLYKTLEFLNSRRPDLEIRASFYHQLTQLESKLSKKGEGGLSSSWQPQEEQDLPLEEDEKLLRNTFMNAKSSSVDSCWLDRRLFNQYLNENRVRTITWADETLVKKSQKKIKSSNTKNAVKLNSQNNISGNIYHVTVNNYVTLKEELEKYNSSLNSRENHQLIKPNSGTIKRQQNDSLKKHQEQKLKQQGKSQSLKQQKRDPTDRPKSAYVQPEIQPPVNIPKPVHFPYRQFSPVVKGNNIPKVTQLIPTNKSKGWRYPSPGQLKNDDDFMQSFINSKPVWK
ncbi:unnamed protein product [Paramecium pentaurelia]|uniref:Tyrosine-protein phosphatase domain-containing protein n=1 Tax=Paramecium pentaurelia TaxID=43138 RepID=A0A8S1Y0A0_9CILI|nr:unnamed protein product [Paramecium pentaurelia]